MKTVVVIPARMASTRLPEKPLIDIDGKSLIQRTYERCILAFDPATVFIATDHPKIAEHCKGFGANIVMTSPSCLTGTDRVAEFAKEVQADYYINVQGDEPLMNPNDILEIHKAIELYPGEIINGYARVTTEEQYRSLTIPKVVFRPDGRLLYMSRTGIPGNKKGEFISAHRQICVYGFPAAALAKFHRVTMKTPLEGHEDIEILRFLELGYEVRMIELSADSVAVDTPADIQRVLDVLRG